MAADLLQGATAETAKAAVADHVAVDHASNGSRIEQLVVISMGGSVLAEFHKVSEAWTVGTVKQQILNDDSSESMHLMVNARVLDDRLLLKELALPARATLFAVYTVPGHEHIESLKDPDPSIRLIAARALGNIGRAAAPHAEQLAGLLRDSDDDVKCCAATALGKLGEAAAPYADELAALLKDPDGFTRSCAAEALGEIGEAAASYASELVALLQSPGPASPLNDAKSLEKPGAGEESSLRLICEFASQSSAPIVAEFKGLLNDADAVVRAFAVKALGGRGIAAAPFAQEFGALLRDADPHIRANAAQALGSLGNHAVPHMKALAALCADADVDVRCCAAQALGELGEVAAPHAAQLASVLEDENEDVRCCMVKALARIGAASVNHIEPISKMLHDPCASVQLAAAEALQTIHLAAAAHARELAMLLRDPGAYILGVQGGAAPPKVDEIIDLLYDSNSCVRRCAIEAIGSLGPSAGSHARELAAFVSDPDSGVRDRASWALRKLGYEAPSGAAAKFKGIHFDTLTIPLATSPAHSITAASFQQASNHQKLVHDHKHPHEVGELLRDPDENVWSSAARALDEQAKVATKCTNASRETDLDMTDTRSEQVAALLRDSNDAVRSGTLKTLQRSVHFAAPYAMELAVLTRDPNDDVRHRASETLGEIGEAASLDATQLTAVLHESSARRSAAGALSKFGKASARHAADFVSLLEDPDQGVRHRAAEALAEIGEAAASHASALSAFLQSDDEVLRLLVLRSFGAMGPLAEDFTEPIAELLTDPSDDVRRTAVEVLGNIY